MTKNNLSQVLGVLVLCFSITGCANTQSSSQASSPKLTDPNIAAIVVGANKIDISAANIALKKSKNDEVRGFAQRMVTDHQSVLDAAVKLVTRLGVTPKNNQLVYALQDQSVNHEKKLNTLSGNAFDKLYIDHEVAYHEAVIDVVKNQLIPGAQNKELKDTLISVLPAFDAHLNHCKMIQKNL